MAGIDYTSLIPNNVALHENRRLQRALEDWQPKFLEWWHDMGPNGFQAKDVYLRTAVSVDAQGWAKFGYVKMPDYRWGIFLAEPEAGRQVNFGDHKGQPPGRRCPASTAGRSAVSSSPRVTRSPRRWSSSATSGAPVRHSMICATCSRST